MTKLRQEAKEKREKLEKEKIDQRDGRLPIWGVHEQQMTLKDQSPAYAVSKPSERELVDGPEDSKTKKLSKKEKKQKADQVLNRLLSDTA